MKNSDFWHFSDLFLTSAALLVTQWHFWHFSFQTGHNQVRGVGGELISPFDEAWYPGNGSKLTKPLKLPVFRAGFQSKCQKCQKCLKCEDNRHRDTVTPWHHETDTSGHHCTHHCTTTVHTRSVQGHGPPTTSCVHYRFTRLLSVLTLRS